VRVERSAVSRRLAAVNRVLLALLMVLFAATCSASRHGSQSSSTTSATVASEPGSSTSERATNTNAAGPDLPFDPRPGLCPSQRGSVANIDIREPDRLPSPRCLVVWANQTLRITNQTSTALTATLGPHGESVMISSRQSHELLVPTLNSDARARAVGVYELKLSPFAVADVWIAATRCPTAETSCYHQPRRPPNGVLSIFDCPTTPLIKGATAQPRSAAIQAATDDVRNKRHWPDATVDAAYPVGAIDQGAYAELFAFQVPLCGNALAEASWVVELTSPTPGQGGSARQAQDVVAHFTGGWRVWGNYH
jgi:hypothetical protein